MFEVFADEDESYRAPKIALCVLLAVLTLLLLLGCSAKADEEITAEAEREAHDKKITFTMPLDWTFSSTQCTKDGCKTRYYYPRSK